MQVMRTAGCCAIASMIWIGPVEATGLIFLSDRDETTEGHDIFVMSPLGSEPVRLTSGLVWHPFPFPDGRRIAYHPNKGGIRVLDWISGQEDSLYGDRFVSYPSISPDGRWLLFSSYFGISIGLGEKPGCPTSPGSAHDWNPEGCNHLYSLELGDDSPTRITDEPGRMNQGLFSPDLSMIAYVRQPQHSYGPGSGVLMVMDRDGSDRRLLHEGPVGRQISWSPDGQVIMFSYFGDYLGDLWTIQPNTGELVRVTETDLYETSPAYSPDGMRVAFVGSDDDSSYGNDIWVSDVGFVGEPMKVTNKPAQYSDVYWLTDSQSSQVQESSWGSIKLHHLGLIQSKEEKD